MNVKLYPHQKEAVANLRSGSILCGGVGSGKSITSLFYFCKIVCKDMMSPRDLYIITTARKRDTLEWEEECAKFSISKDKESSWGHISLIVDSWNNIRKYEEVENAFFIFDEQRVVGSGSWVKSFLKITKKNQWILLSATPGDTWADYIPVFIANGFYKNRTEFFRRHVIYDRYSKYPKIDKYLEQNVLEYYRDQILVKMDYKKERDIQTEDVITEYDWREYKQVMKYRYNPFKDGQPISDAGELCLVLRRIVNSNSSRIEAIEYLTALHPKTIIFYNYGYELELLRKFCSTWGGDYAEWNGHKHEPLPQSDRWIYLVQYAAGGEGWNCIETDTIIFYSQNYSYKTTVQAAGRIDRINSPYDRLYYYRLRSSAPIDIAILRALRNKKNFNESSFAKFMKNS